MCQYSEILPPKLSPWARKCLTRKSKVTTGVWSKAYKHTTWIPCGFHVVSTWNPRGLGSIPALRLSNNLDDYLKKVSETIQEFRVFLPNGMRVLNTKYVNFSLLDFCSFCIHLFFSSKDKLVPKFKNFEIEIPLRFILFLERI